MSTVSVPCTHCEHVSLIQSERLPDRPAFFACPRCKKKVVADKRKLLGLEAPEEAAPSPPVDAAPIVVEPMAPADRRFPNLPPDAALPSGIILGEDDIAIEQVQENFRTLGSELERIDSAETARGMIINQPPELCIYVAGTVKDRPHGPMTPLTGLPSGIRRRLYLVLMADNVETFDGNAAFVFEVNMTLAKRDFAHLGAALHSGIAFHTRLFTPYFLAEEARGSV